MSSRTILILGFFVGIILSSAVSNITYAALHPSYSSKAVVDTVPFYVGGKYDPAVPRPNEFLTRPLGLWPLWYNELVTFINALAQHSGRVVVESHGKTHEGRELFNIFISSPEHIRNLEKYRAAMDKLADPDQVRSTAERDALIESLPAFAWLGYSIHGDELSGVDAAVQLAYHLGAANDSATLNILNNVVVIIDPSENPDGRERYLRMLQTYESHVPNYDAEAMQHGGVWPWGRGNHYLFDLNRDCILATQPETLGKLKTIQKWHPVLAVDGHEMGAYATYLFSPPREPINYNTPANVLKWYEPFQKDQAAAFDQRGWPYYSGEWNEQWYPGYTSAWPTFFGTVGILYEQAGVGGGMIKQRDDYLLTYHESVNHQFTSSLANLATAANNRRELLKDYHEARRTIVNQGRTSRLQFLFVPDADELKTNRFIASLLAQGIKVQKSRTGFTVSEATDIYHHQHRPKEFPAGTYIVNTAQPNGALAKAVLEFDPHFKTEFLTEERRYLEKFNDSRMYEVSAWSASLAYDMEAYATTSSIGAATDPVENLPVSAGRLINGEGQFGFVVDMQGEKTYRLLTRLFDEELTVYASEKPFTIEGKDYKSGSLLLRKRGNRPELAAVLERLAVEIGIDVVGVNTGNSTKGSDLGAATFHLLESPRIALIVGDGVDFTSAGSLWFTIDREIQMPHSLIQSTELGRSDLSKYNVIVIPSGWGEALQFILGKHGAQTLDRWVNSGGTLVVTGRSSFWAADTLTGLSQARSRSQVLDKLEVYQRATEREMKAEAPAVDTMALWHPDKVPAAEKEAKPKGETPSGPPADKKSAEELEKWQQRFMPRGAILRANVDTEDWLAFGLKGQVPVMVYSGQTLLAMDPVKAVARFSPDKNSLRLSGLLWPEAQERWAGSAYATRENKGKGQVILFANDPNIRAYFWGTRRLFVNAILYGPGMTAGWEPYEQQP
ncbi:MAG TPA: M14 family metallopeptidase [Candidatus Deferrimicrobium sp.]|nr:M14 family metallopeptidase [Candidatus Deferrimicrobium sp.]